MWFRLAQDYETAPGEIYRDWQTERIQKGAPIQVRLEFDPSGSENKDFVLRTTYHFFSGGNMRRLTLDMLDTPDICAKDERGDVFCAKARQFFYGSHHRDSWMIAKQLISCPICGMELREFSPYPRNENYADFEIKISLQN